MELTYEGPVGVSSLERIGGGHGSLMTDDRLAKEEKPSHPA